MNLQGFGRGFHKGGTARCVLQFAFFCFVRGALLCLLQPCFFVQGEAFASPAPSTDLLPAPEVVLWHNLGREQAEALRAQTTSFNIGRKVRVRVEDVTDLLASTLKAQLHGRLPEMILSTPDVLSLKKTLRLSKLKRSFIQEQISANTLELATQKNELWGAPLLQGNHLMLYFNKALVNTPAATWQQMALQKLRFAAQGKETILWDFFAPYFFLPFYCGFVACEKEMLNANTLPEPALEIALKVYFELGREFLSPEKCLYECALNKFKSGKVVYFISGDWDFATLQKGLQNNLGIAPLPAYQSHSVPSLYTSYLLMFPGNSLEGPQHSTLLAYLRFLQSKPVQKSFARTGRIPVNLPVFESMKQQSSAALLAMLTQLDNAKPLPGGAHAMIFWSGLQKAFRLLNDKVVNEHEAAQVINTVLAQEHDF